MRYSFLNAMRRCAAVVTRGFSIAASAGALTGIGPALAIEAPAAPTPIERPSPQMIPLETADEISVVAVGDIMPGSMTPIPFVPAPTDYEIPAGIRTAIGHGDVVFGNFEGAFATEGMSPTKCRPEARAARRCFEFGSPPFLVSFLKDAGFTVLSLDNNHAEDYGLEGYALTQGLLAQSGITAVPKRTSVPLLIRDVRVAVVPFGFSGRSFHVSDVLTAQAVVADASRSADIVIVSFHGGAEGEDATRVTNAVETYYEEDRGNLVQFAHAVVDAGADLVIGHGPHVPRAIELYQNRLIAYSLGNFWTYGNISIKGLKGVMPILRVTLDRKGGFMTGRVESMRQRLPGVPEPDPEGTAARVIATLSHEDIPSNPIEVGESGIIRVRRPKSEDGFEPTNQPDSAN
jgi:hypothetical protein